VPYLICENCKQVIGSFDRQELSVPLRAHMFRSKFPPERLAPGPFTPGSEWMYFKCPYCPRRPIFEPNRLFVSDHQDGRDPSYVRVVAPLEVTDYASQAPPDPHATDAPHTDKYACPVCGQEYQNKKRYDMYHKCKARAS